MAVIGRNHDHCVIGVGKLKRPRHGTVHHDGFHQRPGGVAAMVRVIDASALDHQEEPLVIIGQVFDGEFGQLHDIGFVLAGGAPVDFILHVAGFKQSKHLAASACLQAGELVHVPDVFSAFA